MNWLQTLATLGALTLVPRLTAAGEPPLCEAALRAAGVRSGPEIERRLARLHHLFETVDKRVEPNAPARDQAALLLRTLHESVLTGPYNPNLWNVADTLETGSYNCLTATILYLELCKRFNLAASAVHTPGHLLCRVNGQFVVEPTYARWFELDSDLPVVAGRTLNRDQLLAKVHYNQSLAFLAQERYAEALACLRESCRLDPFDQAARANETAALHNWVRSRRLTRPGS